MRGRNMAHKIGYSSDTTRLAATPYHHLTRQDTEWVHETLALYASVDIPPWACTVDAEANGSTDRGTPTAIP